MRTNTYLLTLNDETAEIIRVIALCVPCFITINAMESLEEAEYTICAREADWPWIERKLAPIV